MQPLDPSASSGPGLEDTSVHILVAEDDPVIRNITMRILQKAGHLVLLAEDGELAVRLFEECHHLLHAVVLDIVMPKRDGKAVYHYIRASMPGIPIIFTTGFSPVELEPLVEADQYASLILKPYHARELLGEIDRLVVK